MAPGNVNKHINIITKMKDNVTQTAKKVKDSLKGISNSQKFLSETSKKLNVSQKVLNRALKQGGMIMKRNGAIYSQKSKKVLKQSTVMSRLRRETKAYQQVAKDTGLSVRKASRYYQQNNLRMKNANTAVNTLTDGTKSLGQVSQDASKDAKKFKFEWLGVMFAGMALSRVFGGLIKKQMELFGVTDMLSSMWTIILLPVMMALLPIILKLIGFFMDLPEGVKMAIGIFVVLAAIFGTILMVVGQMALGINAIIGLFGATGLGGVVKAIGSIFVGVSGVVLGVIAIILAAAFGLWIAWKKGWWGAKSIVDAIFSSIKGVWEGFVQFFKGWFQVIHGIFTGNWDEIIEGVKNIFKGWFKWVVNSVKLLLSSIVGILMGLVYFVRWLGEKIIDVFMWIYDKLVGHSIIPDLVNAIIDWFLKLPSKIIGAFKTLARKIASVFRSIIPDWMMDLLKGGMNIVSGGISTVSGLLGSFQTGGVVPQTGPYMLHAGETVVPTGQGNGNGAINLTVNANVSSDMDIRDLAKKLNRYISSEFQRSSLGGTI